MEGLEGQRKRATGRGEDNVENRYICENKIKFQKKQKEERFRLPFPNWNKNLEKYCELN